MNGDIGDGISDQFTWTSSCPKWKCCFLWAARFIQCHFIYPLFFFLNASSLQHIKKINFQNPAGPSNYYSPYDLAAASDTRETDQICQCNELMGTQDQPQAMEPNPQEQSETAVLYGKLCVINIFFFNVLFRGFCCWNNNYQLWN